jgi:hypothetical protein
MSSRALFGGTSGRAQSKNLIEFRAGKMTLKGRMVHPDKRKGMVYVYQSDDSLMHFCWRERSKNTPEDDLIIFPDDVEYKPVSQCTTGRVYLLKFKSNNRKLFFWMQEPKPDKDEEHCRKLNDFFNNPPTPGSSRSAGSLSGLQAELAAGLGGDTDLQSLIRNMDQNQLMHLLGGMGSMSGLSSLMGGRSSSTLSDSTPPSRVQSSPGSRSGTSIVEPAIPSALPRPQTTSVLPVPLAAASTQPTGSQSHEAPVAAAVPTAVGAPAATATVITPRIQLSDLQNILSGFEAMETDAESSREADLSLALTSEAMIPILANAEVQQRLVPLLPEAAELPKTEAELRATMHSPQFQQAVQSFSSALASGQLVPLMRQFGLTDDTVTAAAASGDVLAFAKAMQEALARKRTDDSSTN